MSEIGCAFISAVINMIPRMFDFVRTLIGRFKYEIGGGTAMSIQDQALPAN